MSEKILFDLLAKHGIAYTLFEHKPVFTTKDKIISVQAGQVGQAGLASQVGAGKVDQTGQVAQQNLEEKEFEIPGLHFKSLFLKDKKSNTFYLVTVIGEKRVDFNALSKKLGSSHLSFGSPEELLDLLKITPGSVTPYCLMFDVAQKVKFFLDQDYLKPVLAKDFLSSGVGNAHQAFLPVNFHPLRNDMTIGMAPQDFLKCMEIMGHGPEIICVPEKLA